MSPYLDPIDAANQPRENLIRYLLTAYPLRDPHLKRGFKQLLEEPGTVAQYPYLEGAQPYQTGSTLEQLIDEGVLHPGTAKMFSPTRPLYKHQEEAIRATVGKNENIVVATGTGSGKTECFLIPMMDHLLKHSLPGMQTLILYPMNALVNDQVKRLRLLLCHQGNEHALIRFGFYTSRTEKAQEDAVEAVRAELSASDPEDLKKLLTEEQQQDMNPDRFEELVEVALAQVMRIQAISRSEIWDNPPQILVTNYSMLEHMLIRPKERVCIFEPAKHFKLLVVDEAHSYSGSTGTEVSMLIKRFKAAVGIESTGRMQGIATSATLGDREDPEVLQQVKGFAHDLFGEAFDRIVWGDRTTVRDRLAQPYGLPEGVSDAEVYEYFYDLELLSLDTPIDEWQTQLSYIVPDYILSAAVEKAAGDTHRLLWYALAQHPTIHKLIACLDDPQPWNLIARSPKLWEIPSALDGSIAIEEAQKLEIALSHLIQLGTLARRSEEELPLLPVRLHLLFRSIEGLHACINPSCKEAASALGHKDRPHRYGKLYLNSRIKCDCCNSPVVELASCRKCGQAYGLTYVGSNNELQMLPRSIEAVENSSSIHVLSAGALDSITNDEEVFIEEDELSTAEANDDCIGSFSIVEETRNGQWVAKKSKTKPNAAQSRNAAPYTLHWHRPTNAKNLDGGYISKCPACSAGRSRTSAIRRFVSYTDAPLSVMLDSLFELLPEPDFQSLPKYTKRKLLTFSDGRQDAAFFASDFQRTHTETSYRQLVWQAFQEVQEDGVASVNQVQEALTQQLLEISIPHPDREASRHHRSYVANDSNEETSLNAIDCKKRADSRAKELLVREFALPSARRFSIEALGLIACNLEEFNLDFLERITTQFELSPERKCAEAQLFLRGLLGIIRLTGAIDLQGTSRYFPETGGVDGGLPPRLDTKGRSQFYIKLEKAPKDKNVLSFWWKALKSGQPAKRQNQIVTYYHNFLGHLPTKGKLEWLFTELTRQSFFVKYTDGYQLHWELFNLRETEHDWYQCNTCQQISHVLGLGELKGRSDRGVDTCPAPGCEGILESVQPDALTDHHYRHLIQSREVLPLRSQEHTAQLGTEELSNRENRFRQGKINLLSCSTTLEMGVDIGELQAVALRNFPPHVSNYQQRAGRAGRRTDGVAVTLMYGQRRPHDRYYFEQPIQLIDGKNQVPRLDPANFEIQKRHIRAELLANFLRERKGTGAENVLISEFLDLPSKLTPVEEVSSNSLHIELKEWLVGSVAKQHIEVWLTRLESQQIADAVLQSFICDLEMFTSEQLQDWNGLSNYLSELKQLVRNAEDANESRKQKALEYKRDRIREELGKVQKRRLHEALAKASILPIYGFPIDVVQLLTNDTKQSNKGQGKHRLQRDRRLALGEYAPGQRVVVDDRVHTSVGVMRPEDLSSYYYWVCQSCNTFKTAATEEEVAKLLGLHEGKPKCPTCPTRLSASSQKVKAYKIPKAFVTDWSEQAKVTPYRKPMRQPTSQVFLAQEGDSVENQKTSFFELIVSQGGKFFLSNQGPLQKGKGFNNSGFALCKNCGRDLSKEVRQQQISKGKKGTSRQIEHTHPIKGRPCNGWYEFIHLGHEFRSDLLKVHFLKAANAPVLLETVSHFDSGKEILSEKEPLGESQSSVLSGSAFWRSLTYALLAAAAQVIDIPRSEIDGLFRPLEESAARTVELIIYDNVPGGAGYSKQIADRFKDVLQRAYQLSMSCSCSGSCYDCLRTYTNQVFHHELDRFLVESFLAPIVEQLQPDESLQAFAPDSNRVSLLRMNTMLDRYCSISNHVSIAYLPCFSDPFTLQWLTALVSTASHCSPLELIVNHVPKAANDDRVRVLRKRLAQWIDQGLLKLFAVEASLKPTLCLNMRSPHRVALQLETNDKTKPLEWFQTRSERGLEHVEHMLQALKGKSRVVTSTAMEDNDTVVVFPTSSWGCMSIDSLREQLNLSMVLGDSQVRKIVYSDRYLNCNEHPGAVILSELLAGPWLNESTDLLVLTQQTRDEYFEDRDRWGNLTATRLKIIERALSALSCKSKVDMRQQRDRSRKYSPLPHGRVLEIDLNSGLRYRILFDKGLDFIEQKSKALYCVKESTYVAIVRVN